MIYLDSSAVVKLVHEEAESDALERWLRAADHPLVTSALTDVEVERATRRTDPEAMPLVTDVLAALYRFDLDAAVRRAAGRLAEPTLRTLDAIHLATAMEFGSDLAWFVAYDRRLVSAARERELAVAQPGVRG